MLQYTYRTMNSSKMQRLVLASPLNIPFNFIREIISYEEHCISRIVCKRITEFIDASTESLKVVDDSTIRLVHETEMVEAMKRRLLRCSNVTSIDMSWDLPSAFDVHEVRLMTQLVQVAPRLVKISTDMMMNWMVPTALGTKVYNQYDLDEALTANDVLEIVLRCLVAHDPKTLSLFCSIVPFTSVPSDIYMPHGFVSIASIHFLDDTTVRACYHYINCGSRAVQLRVNIYNMWVVTSLGEKVDFQGLKCIHCQM